MKKILLLLLTLGLGFTLIGCDVIKKDEPVMYTITFTGGEFDIPVQTIETGKKATKPTDPTKDGFTFEGWFVDETEFDFETAITKNTTLTAKWEEIVEVPPTEEENGEFTVNAFYQGETIKFREEEGANNADLINLNPEMFNVGGFVIDGGTYTTPIGLNTNGTIRVYGVRATGEGNYLTIKIKEGYTINKITLTFVTTGTSAQSTMGEIKLDDVDFEFDQTLLAGGNVVVNREFTEFYFRNTHLGGDKNGQIWIEGIEITYIKD